MSQAERHARTIAAALEAARQRDGRGAFVGEAELYCENPDCSVREVAATLKEYDGPTTPHLTCLACRRPLKLHHVRTLSEIREAERREARCSVNAQLYEARERRRLGDELVAVPLSVYLDDSLPEVGG